MFLITDGQVDNTDAVLDAVRTASAATGARVFTVGIGRDASAALVKGMAAASGGDCEFVVDPEAALETAVLRHMGRALQPMLTELAVDWGSLTPLLKFPAAPARCPALYRGSRAVLFAVVDPSKGA